MRTTNTGVLLEVVLALVSSHSSETSYLPPMATLTMYTLPWFYHPLTLPLLELLVIAGSAPQGNQQAPVLFVRRVTLCIAFFSNPVRSFVEKSN